jgi:hypothetical protein
MVDIAQNVQQVQEPNFLGWSKPIQTPEANRSRGIMLSDTARTFDTAVPAFDEEYKQGIERDIFDKANPIREQFIQQLKNDYDEVSTGQAKLTHPNANIMDKNQPEGPPIPEDLKGLPNRVENITAARANNKMSKTQYDIMIDNLATYYRSKYAGHREWVDSVFDKFTGRGVANQTMASILGDLNSYASMRQDKQTSQVNWLRSPQVMDALGPDLAASYMHRALSNDPTWFEEAYKAAVGPMAHEGAIRRQVAELNARKASREETQQGMKQITASQATFMATNELDKAMIGPENKDRNLGEVFGKLASNIPDPEKERALQQKILNARSMAQANFDKWLVSTDPASGMSMAYLIGSTEEIAKAKKDMNDMFQESLDHIANKEYGTAYGLKQFHEAQDDKIMQVLGVRNPALPAARAVMREGGGAAVEEIMRAGLMKDLSQIDFAGSRAAILNVVRGDQGNPPDAPKDILEKLHQGGASAKALDATITDLTKLVRPDTDVTIKKNLADHMFTPENYGMLDSLEKEHQDPISGKWVKGQFSVFSQFSTPEFAHEMQKLGPQVYDKYVDWLAHELGKDMFRGPILSISQQFDRGDPYVKYSYNNTTHTLHADPAPMSSSQSTGPGSEFGEVGVDYRQANAQFAQRQLDMLNQGIRGLVNAAKYNHGLDINGFVLKSLMNAGASSALIQSVLSSVKPEEDDANRNK